MREILFRGRSSNNWKWVHGSYVHRTNYYGDQDDSHFILTGGEFDCDHYDGELVEPETVGQWTGLVDKNGVKIFEGDIVLKRTYNGKKRFPVTFSGGMFHCGYGGGSSTATHPYTIDDKQIEVVGNIYDNKELLEGESDE